MSESLQSQIAQAAQLIAASQRLVVLTGAGVSKESGVPTFRDALDGLWAQYDPQQLATPAAFQHDPKLVWDWYVHRREMIEAVQPNPAHYALAQLEDLLPQVAIITQNIDGLHQLAGSTDVTALHGDIHRYKCSADCQGSPTLIGVHDYKSGQPKCPHCGEWVRPDVVWFGEVLPTAAINRAFELSQSADVMLVIGTSGMVNPAARLPSVAHLGGATLIDINPFEDQIASMVELWLKAPAGETLPRILQAMQA